VGEAVAVEAVYVAAAVVAAPVAAIVPVDSDPSRELRPGAQPSLAAAIANAGVEEAGRRQEEEGSDQAKAAGSEATVYAVAAEHSLLVLEFLDQEEGRTVSDLQEAKSEEAHIDAAEEEIGTAAEEVTGTVAEEAHIAAAAAAAEEEVL
jgi:hypothetical protein